MSDEGSASPDHAAQQDGDGDGDSSMRRRTWLLVGADSPLGMNVAKQAIESGDVVIACALCAKAGHSGDDAHGAEFAEFVQQVRASDDADKRQLLVLGLNTQLVADCQAAVAEASKQFGRIDILLCCNGEALFGTVEELAQSDSAIAAVRGQFSSNFFGPVNMIKAVLPLFRSQRSGHILVLTGITAHIGTPGLGLFCASQWALEGFCDSLAYEIAPFNVKLTIVQPSIEVAILPNLISAVPPMPEYSRGNNPAPMSRALFASLLDRIDGSARHARGNTEDVSRPSRGQQLLNAPDVSRIAPWLPPSMAKKLLAETTHAIMSIGGHDNPPARHIVGHEGTASVKEKLKTVSEELEEFLVVSDAVDYSIGS